MKCKQESRNENCGFSLVELIVVVLIMGILTVGMTPQVLKWVDNARKARDLNYMHSLESAVQFALMDEAVLAEVNTAVAGAGDDIVLRVNALGTSDTISDDSDLLKGVSRVFGFGDDTSKIRGHKISAKGGLIEIHINGGRAVGTYKVNGSEVDMTNE